MSLQVWLPLTKDLRNQGLSDLTFSITNSTETTVNNNGKLGKCYSQSSLSGSGGLISNKTIDLGQNQSMFCWFKFVDLTSSSSLGGGLVSQHRYPSNQGMGITIRYVSSTTGYLSVNTGNGSSRTYNTYYGTTLLQANTWYHGGYTYDGSTLKIYVNGNCEKTQAITGMSVPEDYISCFNWSMASTSGANLYSGYKLHGFLNDVRIYDHCLSPMEVKQLSQGLVLHYPLNRGGFGQENLATITSTNQYQWTAGSNYHYIWLNGGTLEPNTTYTFSAEVTIDNNVDRCTIFNYTAGDYTGSQTNYFPADGKRHSWTFTTSATAVGLIAYAGPAGQDANNTAVYKNIKIEKGDKATPYIPRSNEALYNIMGLNGTTEYDISGFCNNGTRIGTFSWVGNTPKYSVSQYFNNPTGTSTLSDKIYVSASPNLYSPNAITVSFWFKKEAITRGGLFTTGLATTSTTTLAIHDYDSGIKVISSDNTTLSMGSYDTFIPSTNIWYHYVITFDGINAKIYINGDLKTTKSYSGTKTLQNIIDITLGANSAGGVYRSAKGYYSDFRIYATALSADDVLELYKMGKSS